LGGGGGKGDGSVVETCCGDELEVGQLREERGWKGGSFPHRGDDGNFEEWEEREGRKEGRKEGELGVERDEEMKRV